MNDGLIPKRYAKALFKFAAEKGVEKRLYELMCTLSGSFADNAQLDPTIANPYIADDKKTALLTTAAGADSKDTAFADFLKLLRQNNRLPLARATARAYEDIYRQENHIYRVTVSAPAPLDAEEEQRLKRLITDHLKGGTMEYTFRVDPELIGGFAVTIDNERLDASIRNELQQLRQRLLSHK